MNRRPSFAPSARVWVRQATLKARTSLSNTVGLKANTINYPTLAAELVNRQVALIAAVGSPNSGQAAKAATATIPIVFISGVDPVQEGLVASLNRPDGNVTGVVPLLPAMEGKRFGLLREIIPNASLIAVLANPAFATATGK